jgi:tetratricopeptide (TPR) repeat protein
MANKRARPGRIGPLALLLVVAACATPPKPVVEAPVVRPVVVVERAQSELVATLDLLRDGKLRQAEANLEEILKVRPDIPEAHFNLGWVRQRLDRHADAIRSFEDGLRLRPGELRAINLLGISQREAGRFADAEATYRRGLARAPDTASLHLNLGILYELYLQRPRQALEHYRRYQALQAAPDPKVAGWIALLERREGRP